MSDESTSTDAPQAAEAQPAAAHEAAVEPAGEAQSGAPAPDAAEGSGATPIPANPALIPHENADTAGTHGLDSEQLRTRSAQAIADEVNGAP